MKLSILVPVEDRKAFYPWLFWNIRKQTGLHLREVEVLMAGPRDEMPPVPGLVCLDSPRGELVSVKRNKLMAAARGEYIAWMDSDDWHAPDRLATGLAALERGASWVSFAGLCYLRLGDMQWCQLRPYVREPVAITTMARRDVAQQRPFDESKTHGTDYQWLRDLQGYHGDDGVIIRRDRPYFWALTHGTNMSPHIKTFPYNRPLGELEKLCGPDWGDTTEQLEALQLRVSPPGDDT